MMSLQGSGMSEKWLAWEALGQCLIQRGKKQLDPIISLLGGQTGAEKRKRGFAVNSESGWNSPVSGNLFPILCPRCLSKGPILKIFLTLFKACLDCSYVSAMKGVETRLVCLNPEEKSTASVLKEQNPQTPMIHAVFLILPSGQLPKEVRVSTCI